MLGWLSVRYPPCMADSVVPMESTVSHCEFEVADLTDGSSDEQAVGWSSDRQPGGVVTAIFKPLQTV